MMDGTGIAFFHPSSVNPEFRIKQGGERKKKIPIRFQSALPPFGLGRFLAPHPPYRTANMQTPT
jgi:hypothetical protein